MDKHSLGQFGEEQAARYLRRRFYSILERNYRCRFGEIDLIARKGKYLVFVEVKLRKDDRFGAAREFVTPAKQARILAAAEQWLSLHETQLQPRFDVIEVYAPAGWTWWRSTSPETRFEVISRSRSTAHRGRAERLQRVKRRERSFSRPFQQEWSSLPRGGRRWSSRSRPW